MKTIKWFLLNGLFAAMVWFGLVNGVVGARNIAIFAAWFCFVVSLLMLGSEAQKNVAKSNYKQPVPPWLDRIFDSYISAMFIWYGFWLTGLVYFVHMLFLCTFYENIKIIRKEMPV